MRLIDADELKKNFQDELCKGIACAECSMQVEGFCRAERWIDIAPTIEAGSIKHGRWVEHHEPFSWMGYTTWTCSECDYEVGYEKDIKNRTDFCPNCGARMDAQIGEDKSHPFAESVMMGMDGGEE